MNRLYTQFDLIQRAIQTTSHLLKEHGTEAESLQSAREQYLHALSHETLIDPDYLRHIIE
ncbi:DUF3921 family protein [Ectobacillus ponti]|uniref:DUF3921 domain-containing protein n=1 Tax=Ectobacillus ponti TaxID=2961894 RepID=A0AA42BPV6_9BACI|nr:DUF3921 family protein [Ectobacillus ponti]MCP8968801.1 DUF3921 domain-containing protein [Ectobacillus ponti]